MFFSKAFCLLVISSGLLSPALAANDDDNNADTGDTGASTQVANDTGLATSGVNSLTLQGDLVQTASDTNGNPNVTAGDAASEASPNNFINTCADKTLTNGLQLTAGSCNGIPMGDIPASTNMVSTIITSPQTGQTVAANEDMTLTAQVANLNAGSFTNADTSYYAAPQRIGDGGNIIGHIHFTVQSIGSLNPTTPPDAQTFAFFKGVDNDGNGQGLLSATITGGLAAGTYRVCTMSSSSNHQPVLMPVAQRGAQDDCTKFTVADNAASGSSDSTASTASTGSTANTGSTSSANTTSAAGDDTGADTGADDDNNNDDNNANDANNDEGNKGDNGHENRLRARRNLLARRQFFA